MPSQKKIVIIGLDGANKTTAKLVGINTELHDFISTIPPYTPPAWTSILTGVNPAKHGILGWQKIDKSNNKVELTTSKDVKYPRISELLERANLKSILINLPMTFPFSGITRKERTIIISDWASPKQTIFPKELEREYAEYLVDPPHDLAKYKNKKGEYQKKVQEYTETRINLYYDLLEREDWNLYFIVFSETDWFSHIFPEILENKNTHVVAPTFNLIKEFLETSKSIADFVFMVSDHGFEIKNKIFYINEILAENGFIRYNKAKAKIVNIIKNSVPKRVLDTFITKIGGSTSAVSYIAQKADAFMVEPASWGIYSKDRSKILEIKRALIEYDEVLDVIEFNKIYLGPYIDRMPDLIAIPSKGVKFSHELKGKTVEKTYEGDHEIHGVFSAYGDQIKDNITFEKHPRVYDIVPTVLHIFGLPIPNDMDGRVLMEIFEENSEFAKRKPKYVDPSYYEKKQEGKKLKKAIKNLKLKGKL